MWLEIDNERVIGVHSDQGSSDHQWIEYNGVANPGDTWVDGKAVPKPTAADAALARQRAARVRITTEYPEWKQLNILRSEDKTAIERMGNFIDRCQALSNDPETDPEMLLALTSNEIEIKVP